MAGLSTAIAGASAGAGLLSSFFGPKQSQGNPTLDMFTSIIAMQENAARQKQMNLDASRRKRDIIRQAQVATANAEATAFNQGAGKSSVLEGARASISGQAGVNTLGVEQNREIGSELFSLNNLRATVMMQQKQQAAASVAPSLLSKGLGAVSQLGGSAETIGKIGQWGLGQFSSSVSSI